MNRKQNRTGLKGIANLHIIREFDNGQRIIQYHATKGYRSYAKFEAGGIFARLFKK